MESQAGTTDAAVAAAQLAALQADRDRLAERAVQPWWHDVLLGGLLFVLLSALAVDRPVTTVAGVVVFGLGVWWLATAYRRHTGMWVHGLRRGRTRKAMGVWLALYAVVLVPALSLAYDHGQRWALVVAGALLGTALALVNRWWSRIYAAELRGEL